MRITALVVTLGLQACSDAPSGPSPSALLAVNDRDGRDGAGPGLALVRIDGGGYRRVAGPAGDPVWLPGNRQIAFWRSELVGAVLRDRVWIVDVASGNERLLVPEDGPLLNELYPQPSPDGEWLYVTGQETEQGPVGLWRVRLTAPDAGRVAQPIGPPPPPWGTGLVRAHDVARDGRLLIERPVPNQFGGTDYRLAALDPLTGALADLAAYAESPRWSPDARRVAYMRAHNVYVDALDGSAPRLVSRAAEPRPYEAGLTWSPDGRYLVARAIGGLHLIDVAAARATPLPPSGSFYEPAWQR